MFKIITQLMPTECTVKERMIFEAGVAPDGVIVNREDDVIKFRFSHEQVHKSGLVYRIPETDI